MSETEFDLVIIGGGPGGYVAALRAAQLGMRVACVDRRARLGGTCLNVGCIPSKALLHSSEHFAFVRDGLAAHGVKTGKVGLDLAAMMARKDKVVDDLGKGIDFLFDKNKVVKITGAAIISAPGEVTVKPAKGKARKIKAARILIATGSDSAALPGIEIDEKKIVTSTGALALAAVPKRLVVIGAGAIGLELGSIWRRLGAEVTVVEFLDRILPGMDGDIAKQTQRILARQGLAFKLATKVAAAKKTRAGIDLSLEPANGKGKAEKLTADVVLVAVGRRPRTEGLGLEAAGVALDARGFIEVDANFRAGAEGVYAIGDVIGGAMLAHKAEEEGVAVAEILAGKPGHVNYGAIPAVVYTWPEVATVGQCEEDLKEAGIDYRVGKFPFAANSRARTNGFTDGVVKILADAATDRVLGVHILGPDAGTLIAEAAIAMEFGASSEDIARTCHAHPSLPEAMKEAALAVAGRALHA
ncbi:MAG: dihydrolipoyl dehydrogenase [Alphaproteobacteria bacterium]